MLKTETNTPEMESRIRTAFATLHLPMEFDTDFEHGQWWVTAHTSGRQWSVVDADGPGSVDGFGFEVVTEGDEA